MEAAWVAGMRYFDTAPLYGFGLSEARIGRVLAGRRRDDFVISTKVGRLLDPCPPGEADGGIYADAPPLKIRYDYSYDGIMRSYGESLKRLGLGRVDILFVHDVDARTHGGEAGSRARIAELDGGRRLAGAGRAARGRRRGGHRAGVNEWRPCARLLEVGDPDLFLLAGRYTLLEQEPLANPVSDLRARGVGVVNGGPFNSGVLAGGDHYDYGAVPRPSSIK